MHYLNERRGNGMKELYDMIFKRKSVRRFDEALKISNEEMKRIRNQMEKLIALVEDIRVKFEIVERAETSSKRGEYCLLFYSEVKPHYLLNAGYLLEQLDLFLASMNIGVCWYALAKPKELKLNDLEYVIMLAFGKSRLKDFRKDVSKCKRKNTEEIWNGKLIDDIANVVKYAPSACNTQPWRVICYNNNLSVYRNKLIKCFFSADKLPYYNSIDMGIFLCFLEITLGYNGYEFDRLLCPDEDSLSELIETATYTIKLQ